jgi:branched-chain amino acid transport system ATP-binding protein
MILETKKISKRFGSLAALTQVDLSVEEGEIFGIAGPNGAGKSTLFNVIAGHYPVSGGRIIFGGVSPGFGAHLSGAHHL